MQAYDDALAKVAAAETARVVKIDARGTAERRIAMAAELDTMADELRERFKKMIAHPMTEQRVVAGEAGELSVVVEPARWRLGDLPHFARAIAELRDVSIALADLDEGLTDEAVRAFTAKLYQLVDEEIGDPAGKVRVLSRVQGLLDEMGGRPER